MKKTIQILLLVILIVSSSIVFAIPDNKERIVINNKEGITRTENRDNLIPQAQNIAKDENVPQEAEKINQIKQAERAEEQQKTEKILEEKIKSSRSRSQKEWKHDEKINAILEHWDNLATLMLLKLENLETAIHASESMEKNEARIILDGISLHRQQLMTIRDKISNVNNKLSKDDMDNTLKELKVSIDDAKDKLNKYTFIFTQSKIKKIISKFDVVGTRLRKIMQEQNTPATTETIKLFLKEFEKNKENAREQFEKAIEYSKMEDYPNAKEAQTNAAKSLKEAAKYLGKFTIEIRKLQNSQLNVQQRIP